MVLLINTHPCNTSGFVTSGSKSTCNSHFIKLNKRKDTKLVESLGNFAMIFRISKRLKKLW